jgi:hypothetical protein
VAENHELSPSRAPWSEPYLSSHVIAARGIAKDANLGAPSAPLSGDYCGKAIHRSFIVARRLAPHKIAEQPHHVLLAILQFAENF